MLHLFVFQAGNRTVGVEAYHREQAEELAGMADLIYCASLRINGGESKVVFRAYANERTNAYPFEVDSEGPDFCACRKMGQPRQGCKSYGRGACRD